MMNWLYAAPIFPVWEHRGCVLPAQVAGNRTRGGDPVTGVTPRHTPGDQHVTSPRNGGALNGGPVLHLRAQPLPVAEITARR